jgi:hypothetical protein
VKISRSVRELYENLKPKYEELKKLVDALVSSKKERRWHYESRTKEEQSFALKLETGRERNLDKPEDFFACTLVVENHSRIADAEKFVLDLFDLQQRRPKDPAKTHLAPHSFDFDDLRLYVAWKDDPASRPTGFNGVAFEVQIKTFLQHAWGIATHDFIYKSDDVDWPASRIAYQVKAMLENAELSIGEAKNLTASAMMARTDGESAELQQVIAGVKERWSPAALPNDLRRLAKIIIELRRTLRVKWVDLWAALDEATGRGEGAKTLNLSPYGALVEALISKYDVDLFEPLGHPKNRQYLFIPTEIAIPNLPNNISRFVIRTKAA